MPSGVYDGEKVVWDDTKERHLLIIILLQCNTTTVDWDLVVEKFGAGTVGALKQKYSKIRIRDAEAFGMKDAGDAGTPKVKKPRKTPIKKKKADDDEDNSEEETPVKKKTKVNTISRAKATRKGKAIPKSNAKVEDEDMGEDEDEGEGEEEGEVEAKGAESAKKPVEQEVVADDVGDV